MKKIVNITGRVMQILLGVLLLSSAAYGQEKKGQQVKDFCEDFFANTSALINNDAQGCFIKVNYLHPYSTVGLVPLKHPHGIKVKLTNATILSTPTPSLTGGWTVAPLISSTEIKWKKPFVNGIPPPNYIPPSTPLTLKIYINVPASTTLINVVVYELDGSSGGSSGDEDEMCFKQFTFPAPQVNYSIGPNTSVCSPSSPTITLSPLPPSGATVTWYKSTAPCPTVNPPLSPWVFAGTGPAPGAATFIENYLTNTTCYVAVIQQGCWKYFSNVKRVDVCPGPPAATITATGPPTTIINEVPHFCVTPMMPHWSGQLWLDPQTFPCPTTIVGWEKRTRTLTYPSPCNPQWGPWVPPLPDGWTLIIGSAGQTNIPTGNLITTACKTQYEFRAVLQNVCGTSYPSYTIVIDRLPVPGNITASPLPPLCFDKATKLSYSSSCAEVVEWEKRDELSPCTNTWGPWTTISGSQGTCVWWTNNLLKTTQYRVKVKNGACPPVNSLPVYSPVYTVKVKPELGVTITANKTVLCPPGPVILTAQTTYGPPCNYPVIYRWYQDGLPIAGATGSTYSPTTGGNYYVVVRDGLCDSAKSNVITVCNRPQLVIEAPCCVCPGETITVTAKVLWTPANCLPPSCTYLWNTGASATTPSISVTSPGTYTVTVSCGTCPPMTQSVTIQPCL